MRRPSQRATTAPRSMASRHRRRGCLRGALVQKSRGSGDTVVGGVRSGIQPLDARLRTEPRRLALGERDVALRVELDRGVPRERAVEDGPCLAIADRRERGQARVESLAQRARFLDEPGIELLPRTPLDPLAMDPRRKAQAEPMRRGRRSRWVAEGRRRRAARRSRARGRLGGGWRGRCATRGAARWPRAARPRARARPARSRPRSPRARPRRTAAPRRPARARPRAGTTRFRRQGSRCRLAPRWRAGSRGRAGRSPRPRTRGRGRRDRARGAELRPAPPPAPSPSRCPCPGTPGASRPR